MTIPKNELRAVKTATGVPRRVLSVLITGVVVAFGP